MAFKYFQMQEAVDIVIPIVLEDKKLTETVMRAIPILVKDCVKASSKESVNIDVL